MSIKCYECTFQLPSNPPPLSIVRERVASSCPRSFPLPRAAHSSSVHRTLLLDGWILNGFSLETKGNDCYMEYPFTGTGVSVLVSANWDHGPYSCQLDGGDPQWFNANSPTNLVDVGCSISGVVNQQHTLRVTNAPISGLWLSLGNITVTQGDQNMDTNRFTSTWPSYQLPPSLSRQMHRVPLKVFAPVTAVLATLCFASVVAAIYLLLEAKFNLLCSRRCQQPQARTASPDVENKPETLHAKRNSQSQNINTHNVLQQLTLLKEREDGDNNIKQTSADDVEEPEKPLQAA